MFGKNFNHKFIKNVRNVVFVFGISFYALVKFDIIEVDQTLLIVFMCFFSLALWVLLFIPNRIISILKKMGVKLK